jgi:tRNA G46 methylase TrmB
VHRLSVLFEKLLKSKNKFTLEIGCGHGHWLTAYAKENPQKLCVGYRFNYWSN